ncbi:uncharacterized protein LOC131651501 [Vicia villosa]|uniref:uncharacterized protein LOC131651501 n=1 Tax=Vicia villosa TaxID=3911 RepID=UPI00273C3876|nr:uncharacterized protein LOC131651501 [Vicia villosa]
MPPKPSNPTPKDLEESIQHTNLRLDDLILSNKFLESTMESNNQSITEQLDQMDNNLESRLIASFAELSSLMTQQVSQLFATMTSAAQPPTSAAQPPRSTATGISNSILTPASSENVVISTSFPLLHVPLPVSQPLYHGSSSNHQLSTPPSPPSLSFPQTQPTVQPLRPPFSTYQTSPFLNQPNQPTQQSHLFSPFLQQPTQPQHSARHPKIELSVFDGSNALEWLFQSEQFFGFYNIPIENRLPMAAFYMRGNALGWVIGLPPEAMLNCFISGLIPEIRNEIAIHQPYSISQAVGLAKLIEAKLKDSKTKFIKHPPSGSFPHPPSPTIPKPNTTNPLNPPVPSTPTSTNGSNSTNHFPIRRITAAQREERRAKGLCFNCDEKFIPGHRCAAGKFLLLMIDEDSPSNNENDNEGSETVDDVSHSEETYFQLSPQAISGQLSPKTLKFKGILDGLSVTVLIDTGSTHNILQPRIAQHLKIPTKPIPNFSVMVGNGSQLNCSGICPEVPITLQQHLFFIPFYLLPIEGADVVLGMQWLRTLGPLLADFSIPKISFTYNQKEVTITGEPKTTPSHSSYQQFCHLLHTDSIASIHLLLYHPNNVSPSNPDFTANLTSALDFPQPTLPREIQTVLENHSTIFQTPKGLPPSRMHDHHIPLKPNSTPVNVKPYRYPHSQKEAMTAIISDMLRDGIIKPSNSPYSSPVLLVRKKDGTWRFCVDYRALNAITIRDRFPIPTIDELFDELGSASLFTKIDLRSGYHQIRVTPEDTHKTAFRTFDGHYEFLVMPFGLTNAPSSFQAAMNDLLRPYLRRFVLVFFDDILIYSSCLADHVHHLTLILTLLSTNQFFAKLSKCVFAVSKVDYLGHIISANGVTPDPSKIQAVLDWPRPRSLTTLRGFLGLTGFYRRFVRHYASHAAPLTDLLRFTKFTWSTTADTDFTTLKKKMTETPVLALPDFSKTFILETDASAVAIGAVLSQDNHPLAFFSKKMCNRMQASSVYVREMYAITEAVKKWRQYLIGRHFHIFTDQKSLKNLLVQTIQTPEQQKWASKLQGFSFDIFYKPGKHNQVADALSRKHTEDEALFFSISSPMPLLLEQLQQHYIKEKHGIDLLAKYNSDPSMQALFSFKNNILFYKDKIYLPQIPDIKEAILQEFHATLVAGHSGFKPTLSRIASSFNWPGMHKDVKMKAKVHSNNNFKTESVDDLPTARRFSPDHC